MPSTGPTLQAGKGAFAELPQQQGKVSEVTDTITYVSRRERPRAARKSLASANAASAGRATAAVLAASGLVISTGVAANASAESSEDREPATVQPNASELNVERASNNDSVAVTASSDAELSFDRPVVTSEA